MRPVLVNILAAIGLGLVGYLGLKYVGDVGHDLAISSAVVIAMVCGYVGAH